MTEWFFLVSQLLGREGALSYILSKSTDLFFVFFWHLLIKKKKKNPTIYKKQNQKAILIDT